MQPILDNPAWNALSSGNSNLAFGDDNVKYFDREVSPFVGLKANTPENFEQLHAMIQHGRAIVFISTEQTEIPSRWELLNYLPCLQMIYEGEYSTAAETELLDLTDEHIPQMLALTKLTNPGPFAPRTIDFGHYKGIFDSDKLVAMAGQRMHIFNYAEISAVCTHPDYLGRGYAKSLLLYQANRIKEAGEIPMLHVRETNDRAVSVYESLGFVKRTTLHFHLMQPV